MSEIQSLGDVSRLMNEQDGITAHTNPASWADGQLLVKVRDEDAVGRFFQLVRQNGLGRRHTTRNCLPGVVLDSWVMLDDED